MSFLVWPIIEFDPFEDKRIGYLRGFENHQKEESAITMLPPEECPVITVELKMKEQILLWPGTHFHYLAYDDNDSFKGYALMNEFIFSVVQTMMDKTTPPENLPGYDMPVWHITLSKGQDEHYMSVTLGDKDPRELLRLWYLQDRYLQKQRLAAACDRAKSIVVAEW